MKFIRCSPSHHGSLGQTPSPLRRILNLRQSVKSSDCVEGPRKEFRQNSAKPQNLKTQIFMAPARLVANQRLVHAGKMDPDPFTRGIQEV